eukprot:20875_1
MNHNPIDYIPNQLNQRLDTESPHSSSNYSSPFTVDYTDNTPPPTCLSTLESLQRNARDHDDSKMREIRVRYKIDYQEKKQRFKLKVDGADLARFNDGNNLEALTFIMVISEDDIARLWKGIEDKNDRQLKDFQQTILKTGVLEDNNTTGWGWRETIISQYELKYMQLSASNQLKATNWLTYTVKSMKKAKTSNKKAVKNANADKGNDLDVTKVKTSSGMAVKNGDKGKDLDVIIIDKTGMNEGKTSSEMTDKGNGIDVIVLNKVRMNQNGNDEEQCNETDTDTVNETRENGHEDDGTA